MTQKDKVKELVGRGLHSYHTKSLQQMDRIEKKNKEQNHKISILSNELDNDYLTKTEEGSVISLEHSKEGMVYLDELQGNTLVNYCTDGSKELTLNGDIDTEGTFVTTTEGVDNGKVDVMCEGNTLVNKLYKIKDYGSITEFINHGWSATPNSSSYEWIDNGIKMYALSSDTRLDRYYRSSPEKHGIFKKNRTYIVRMNVNSNDLRQNATILRCFYGNGTAFIIGQMSEVVNGVFIKKATTSSTIEEVDAIHSMISLDYRTPQGVDGWVSFQNVMVIDVTDLPSYQQDVEYWRNIEYFEGMKSVGQDDENGHKIEILSNNKNLLNLSNVTRNAWGVTVTYNQGVLNINGTLSNEKDDGLCDYYLCGGWTGEDDNLKLKPNTKYTFSGNVPNYVEIYIIHNAKVLCQLNGAYNNSSFTNSSHGRINAIMVRVKKGFTFSNTTINIQIEEGSTSTSFIAPNLNKKEILLNEPLRSVPNGAKDKFVKIGGKSYIERNCGYAFLDKNRVWKMNENATKPIFETSISDIITITQDITGNKLICDKLQSNTIYSTNENNGVCFVNGSVCRIRVEGLTTLEEYTNWIASNPITIIFLLPTPIYEPLEIEPTLNTYNDITHISNNSIIPCNMKIKNSGYNAIIKPSTLYTVALDTNKSGTIGMNLGGAKGTTTNNVLTLTTPATLTDDSLRLYGKGIKGSKVRLLEGDKTNWIPSFFEGMKSSFEDKVQEDGSYKMEILSNNENLLDLTQHSIGTPYTNHYIIKNNSIIGIYEGDNYTDFQIWFNLKRNRTYKLSYSQESTYKLSGNNSQLLIGKRSSYSDGCVLYQCYNGSAGIITNVPYDGWYTLHFHSLKNNNTIKDLQLKESNLPTDFVERKYNKIQFSSIEPLRSTKDISDRFVFKDDKIMIERNCVERDLTYFKFSTTEIKGLNFKGGITISDAYRQPQGGANTTMKCDKLASDFKEDTIPCINIYHHANQNELRVSIPQRLLKTIDKNGINDYFANNPHKVIYRLAEPYYEEIPFELQKIILEGYENGTLFFDTNIPPTSTVTYAGETPIVKSVKLNKTEVLNNTNDINDNIVPYLMDMDYRVVCLQLQSENINDGVSMTRLFGGTYEMLQRDIQSNRYSVDEYRHRLDAYLDANKITEEEYNKLGDMLNE